MEMEMLLAASTEGTPSMLQMSHLLSRNHCALL